MLNTDVVVSLSDSSQKKLDKLKQALNAVMYDFNLHQECLELGECSVKNPAVIFTENAKAGMYDNLSDEDYHILSQKVQHLSDVNWQGKPCISVNYETEIIQIVNKSIDLIASLEHISHLFYLKFIKDSYMADLNHVCSQSKDDDTPH